MDARLPHFPPIASRVAGVRARVRPLMLVSYAYFRRLKEDFWHWAFANARILIDSGAFTAWKSGKSIELREYTDWLREVLRCGKPEGYFTLDVVGDPVRTRAQWDHMRADGFDPIPIFTPADEWSTIDGYYRDGAKMVAAGGLVGSKNREGHIVRFMREADGRPVHWLGYITFGPLMYYKPASCDSSSLSRGARFGLIHVYMGHGRWSPVLTKEKVHREGGIAIEVRRVLAQNGFDYKRLQYAREWSNSDSRRRLCFLIQAANYRRYADELEKRGIRLYVAVPNSYEAQRVVEVANGECKPMED